jgi:hypothetical protein
MKYTFLWDPRDSLMERVEEMDSMCFLLSSLFCDFSVVSCEDLHVTESLDFES